MKTFVSSKIHGIRATTKSVHYHGSVSIGENLLREAKIQEYEQVHVVNLTNGARWITYAIKAPNDVFSLNGGGARLGEVGDEFVVMTYAQENTYSGANVIHCDKNNQITSRLRYENS